MSDEPLVSIVVNNYNYGRFLAEAIDSALGQTYRQIEVIVVDDGSTDDSHQVITRYQGRVKEVFKTNGGQGSAFNAGLAASQGPIVMFLDADDWLVPTAAEEVVRAWRPGLAKVQFRMRLVDQNGCDRGVNPSAWIRFDSGSIPPILMRQGRYVLAPTSGNAFSREVLEKVFPVPEQEFRILADYFLNYSTVFFGDVLSIDKVLACYRLHGSNAIVTAVRSPRQMLEGDLCIHRLIRTWAGRSGVVCPEDLSDRDYGHLLNRMASFKDDRSMHPYPADTRLGLIRRALHVVWRPSGFNLKRKLAWSAYWFVIAFLPRRYALKIFEWIRVPFSRPEWLKKLVSSLQSFRKPKSTTVGTSAVLANEGA